MRQQHCIFLLLLLWVSTTSCSPGHLGSNVIAFVRAGHLWTIDPNGANAFEMVAQDKPVVGFSWSPTHQILSYRVLDTAFAKTSAAEHFSQHSISGLITDAPSTLNTIGVDGGTPISIAFSSPDVRYSNALWSSSGTRLLYRQTAISFSGNPATVNWWVSQNDQPGGIAVKSLPGSYSIPSLSYDDFKAIGNSRDGLFTTTLAGTQLQSLTHTALPGHPLPASLERVLWQPGHHDRSFLYALGSPLPPQSGSGDALPPVVLVLQSLSGLQSTLAMCTCTQFDWSPNGNFLLYSTTTQYSVLNMQDHSSFTIPVEQGGVPYWSPDSSFLLLDEPHQLILVNMSTKQQSSLLATPQQSAHGTSAIETIPATNALLQPVANSIWAADSRHFLFLTRDRLLWQARSLHAGNGLYTVTIDKDGRPQGDPVMVDAANDTQPGWTYQDANTSFLY